MFRSIAQRIGLEEVNLLNSPRHVVIAYKPSQTAPLMIIDAFNNRILDLTQCNEFLVVSYTPSNLPVASATDLLYRMLGNLRQIFKTLLDNRLVSVISFMLLIKEQANDYILRILLNKSRGFKQLAWADYERVKQMDCFDPDVLSRLESHILSDADLHTQEQEVVRLRTSPENRHVRYGVGFVFRHVRYGYRGVVFRWDPKCLSSDEWVHQMGVHLLPRSTEQPFYSVLVDSRDNHGQITYG